ncbi:hypothetical protein EW146_g9644 [Bondarzewia mesenterica]|uniref:Uncharacterized protein n=1 Tax=Bondarzewia mesenterica TaxID=1095465 RepID=A0A4S4L4S7_9AGAM|nr:hypothetical protein EW146_g9644 [Bondarzewia mesenterica]
MHVLISTEQVQAEYGNASGMYLERARGVHEVYTPNPSLCAVTKPPIFIEVLQSLIDGPDVNDASQDGFLADSKSTSRVCAIVFIRNTDPELDSGPPDPVMCRESDTLGTAGARFFMLVFMIHSKNRETGHPSETQSDAVLRVFDSEGFRDVRAENTEFGPMKRRNGPSCEYAGNKIREGVHLDRRTYLSDADSPNRSRRP